MLRMSLLLTIGIALAPAAIAQEQAAEFVLCESGKAAFEKSDYAEAAQAYRREAASLPAESAAQLACRSAMAEALFEAGELEEAETVLRDVLAAPAYAALPPAEQFEARNRLVSVLLQRGRIGEGADSALQVLSDMAAGSFTEPEVRGRARYNQIAALVYSGAKDEAIDKGEALAADLNKALSPTHRLSLRMQNLLAYAYGMNFRYNRAAGLYRAMIPLSEQAFGPVHREHLIFRNNLASVLLIQGKTEEAEPILLEIAQLREERYGPTYFDTVVSYANLARLYMRQGRHDAAEPFVLRTVAGQRAQQAEATPGIASSLLLLGEFLDEGRGDRSAAIFAYKQGIEALQEIQSGLEEDARPDFVKSWYRAYETLQSWLISEGRLGEAEAIGRIFKIVEYDGFVRGENGGLDAARPDFTAREAAWKDDFSSWSQRPVQLSRELAQLRASNDADPARIAALEAAYDEAYARYRDDIGAWLVRIEELDDTAMRDEARALGVEQSERLQGTVADLGEDVVLLQVAALGDSIHFFLITPDSFVHRTLATDRATLSNQIYEFRDAIVTGAKSGGAGDPVIEQLVRDTGRDLYNSIFAPVAEDIAASGANVVMLNMQGPLRYVPFSALHDGEQFLIERYALTLFNPAARTVFDGSEGLREGLGFGLSQKVEGFTALPEVRRELDAVLTGSDASGVLSGSITLDEEFTRESFERGLAERAPVLHVASHFSMNPGDAGQSFLVLGDGSRLSLSEINRSPRLRFRDVELVTLSACQTGISGEGSGLEIDGLGALIQNKGADSVMASLWSVDDDSTADLMIAFYSALAEAGTSKAEALRRAQLSLLEKEDSANPFYWAPFILMGDWK